MIANRNGGDASGIKMGKKSYKAPSLTVYGSVKDLTRTGQGSGTDGGSGDMQMVSDPACKENIVRVGDHPAGVGLYLFDYKAEFRGELDAGRHFGVMADEVEAVLPQAVSIGSNGYRLVDYSQLGISFH